MTGAKSTDAWGRLKNIRLKSRSASERVGELEIVFAKKSFVLKGDQARWIIRRPSGEGLRRNSLDDADTSVSMPSSSDIRIAHDPDKWAKTAVTLIHEVGEQAVQDHGAFLLALSGGSTPERLYQTMSSSMYADRYDWSQTGFFFSDERSVPPGHPDSNFGLADRTLFRPFKNRDDQIHRMAAEAPDADQAARDYERQLRVAVA